MTMDPGAGFRSPPPGLVLPNGQVHSGRILSRDRTRAAGNHDAFLAGPDQDGAQRSLANRKPDCLFHSPARYPGITPLSSFEATSRTGVRTHARQATNAPRSSDRSSDLPGNN